MIQNKNMNYEDNEMEYIQFEAPSVWEERVYYSGLVVIFLLVLSSIFLGLINHITPF